MVILTVPEFLYKFRVLRPGVMPGFIQRNVRGLLLPLLSPSLQRTSAPTVRANVAGVAPYNLPPDSEDEEGVLSDEEARQLEQQRAEVHDLLSILQPCLPALTNGGVVVGRRRVLYRVEPKRLLEECWYVRVL
jgi:hypothetical protein